PGTGWWFHCHTGDNDGPSKRSLRDHVARGAASTPGTGLNQVRGLRPRLPGTPKYGQPSCQVSGEMAVVRPMDLRSIIEKPHHCPSGACTIPPWCSGTAPSALAPGLCMEKRVAPVGTGVRWPTASSHQPRWVPKVSPALITTRSEEHTS